MALCRGVRREWLVGRCSSISNTVVRARVSFCLGKPYSSLSSFVSVICEVGFVVPFSVTVLSVRVFCAGFRAVFLRDFLRVFALCGCGGGRMSGVYRSNLGHSVCRSYFYSCVAVLL